MSYCTPIAKSGRPDPWRLARGRWSICRRCTTLGPLLALLAACVFFASQTDRFLTGQNFSLILQQVMVVGVAGHRPDARHPDRRDRPVLRHGDGARLDRDDQVRGRSRHESVSRDPVRIAGLHRVRLAQRRAGHLHQAAAVHRHAGHAQHRLRDHADLLAVADRRRACRTRCCSSATRSRSARPRSPTARC